MSELKNMKYRAFVINLDGSEGRMSSIKSSLDMQMIPFSRVSAVDGRGLSPDLFDEYHDSKSKKYYGRALSGAEVACYLSHIKALKLFLESDADVGIIFEDDVKIDENFKEVFLDSVDKILYKNKNWGFIHFRPRRHRYKSFVSNVLDRKIYQLHEFPVHTGGIAYSRAGAKLAIGGSNTVYAPWDIYLKDIVANNDNGFGIIPHLIYGSDLKSDISPVGSRGEIIGVTGWLAKQRRIIRHEVLGFYYKVKNLLTL